ncbi:uncharacterized protein SETTUDRAFT_140106 [Exserohilum turcica Et28A]|uniref:Peroxin 26 n=1 Tax=Exserohilum turcicum (strain 28A) TaxID=671987 RepID=R0IEC9_EXST2|nr:uncharacterized protein SETTUDRAFT_140106 [Exserohilum turcica Et28A]EOA83496.1 hypothetical protein SETTUDRAFT_140106 [Exserohilum turcica Et28A]
MATVYDQVSGSRYLSSSISSLSASRQQASQIAKAYRQAAQLFLTRRLPEALSTIEPIITPPPLDDDNGAPTDLAGYAPVATASRGTRVKVWSFYLTFLNAVIELGAEDGKHAFGSTRWKQLVSKCRDGSIWDDVVRDGYAGVEGDVDADVVINLATLLLTHAPSQRLNQQKLETYLSAAANPILDVASHMSSQAYLDKRPGSSSRQHAGTDTPRDLEKRIKLLELYTLHVLPRNDEWDYAREFITMSEVLDDERKEAFLLALHSLKEEKEDTEAREEKLRQQQQEQMEQRRRETEARRLEQSRAEDERRKREEENRRQPRGSDDRFRRSHPTPQPTSSQSSRTSRTPSRKPMSPPPGFYNRASTLISNLQAMISNTAQSMTANPMAFLRTLLFLIVFGLALGRRDLRERILRIIRTAWDKVRRTVGMGVKVSYI